MLLIDHPVKYRACFSQGEQETINAQGNSLFVYCIDDIFNTQQLLNLASLHPNNVSTFLQYTNDQWLIRWFENEVEIKRCGIGSLAAAKFIYDRLPNKQTSAITFHSAFKQHLQSEAIHAKLHTDKNRVSIFMQAQKLQAIDHKDITALFKPTQIRFAGFTEDSYIHIELFHAHDVEAFNLSLPIKQWLGKRALIISAASCNKCDFIFRYFAPAYGKDEDAATGSAAVVLAPYWQKRLNKDYLIAHQRSKQEAFFNYALNSYNHSETNTKTETTTIEIIAYIEQLNTTK